MDVHPSTTFWRKILTSVTSADVAAPPAATMMDQTVYTLATTLNGAAEVALVISESIPRYVSQAGTLSVMNDAGTRIDIVYTAYNPGTKTFTIAATDFSTNNALDNCLVYIGSANLTITIKIGTNELPFHLPADWRGTTNDEIVLEPNEKFKGPNPPRLSRREIIYMDPSTFFAALQNGEVDVVDYERLTPADIDLVLADPVLSENYLRHFGDFRTDYLLFDTFNPPFNDLNVRNAFAKAVDRESIVTNVYGEIKAMPAYSFLMPGFPSSDVEGALKEYQMYDCEAANQHLTDAGFPGLAA